MAGKGRDVGGLDGNVGGCVGGNGGVSVFVVQGGGGEVVVAGVGVAAAGAEGLDAAAGDLAGWDGGSVCGINLSLEAIKLTRSRHNPQPKRIRRRPIRIEDDIVTLANTQDEMRRVIRDQRHEILRHNFHLVVVDADEQHTFGARVDEAHEMLLAGLQLEHGETGVVDAGAVGG